MFNVSVRDMKLTESEMHRLSSSKVKAEDDVEKLVKEYIEKKQVDGIQK